MAKKSWYIVGGLLPTPWRRDDAPEETYKAYNTTSENAAWRAYYTRVTGYKGYTGVSGDTRVYLERVSAALRLRRPSCSEMLGHSPDRMSIFINTHGVTRDDLGENVVINVWHGGNGSIQSLCEHVLTDLYTSSPFSMVPAVIRGDQEIDFEFYMDEVRKRVLEAKTFGDAAHAILEPNPLAFMSCDLYIKRGEDLVLNSRDISTKVTM